MQRPQVRIRLDFSASSSLGPGKIVLLEHIASTGSLAAAARALGMSYRRAWLLVHDTNASFTEPVVAINIGGRDGGGARLTDFGVALVNKFRTLEKEVDKSVARIFADIQPVKTVHKNPVATARRMLNRPINKPAR